VSLARETVTELLEHLAARTPAPGAGSAAALAGATAAALSEMVCAFAPASAQDESARELARRARELRARLLELGDADTRAYRPVLDALALDHADSRRAATLAAALSGAAEVPLKIAAASCEVAELAARAPASEQLQGEARGAAILAEAATRAAVGLVAVNLASSAADPRTAQAAELAERARSARASLAADER
jgi:formiminotetrahydrofolate cyclodeaminase